ncbi:MAG TPA: murein L,D-transpeptidase catalytic domain family protein [Solimonas sp.]|nr:murein L,D-transpeptidase catalytic domain family protein [Solimonas sp.]
MSRSLRAALAFAIAALLALPAWAETTLAAALQRSAPGINTQALQAALSAMACAEAGGMPAAQRLALIDYSLPSTQRRLWVFDLQRRRLLLREWVAHGRNSGDNLPTRFSNEPDSLTSSLGLFRTLAAYDGRNGYSLRMDGLEPGINDRAYERALVIHGAGYVDVRMARRQGRLGRSWGCPAVRAGVARELIDTLKDGQLVFAWHPDQAWLQASKLQQCPARSAPLLTAAAD